MATTTQRHRRHQSRTVVSGRLSASAILRCPHPAASICSARPITSTTSQRLGSHAQAARLETAEKLLDGVPNSTPLAFAAVGGSERIYPDGEWIMTFWTLLDADAVMEACWISGE